MKFLYDGADLLAETNAAGTTITAHYLYGPGIDEPLERKGGSTTSYYSQDELGSTVHLTDSAGTIAESYTYEVFGQPTIRDGSGTVIPTSAVGNRFLFTGREWDSETGLYYYRARYYNPKTGRFLSRDPLGYLPDVNLYRCVGNDPTSRIDPSGLEAKQPTRNLKNPIEGDVGFGPCCGASRDCSISGAPLGASAQQQACAVHDRTLDRLNQEYGLTYKDYDRVLFDETGRPYKPVADANKVLLDASTNPLIRLVFGGRRSDPTVRIPNPNPILDPSLIWSIPHRSPSFLFY